jgi:alkylhydroperoxidase/carboxymuconolactone decarboxylase family protein YurZ
VRHDHEDLLRRLALSDEDAVASTLAMALDGPAALDPKTRALVRLASLIALSSACASLQWSVARAVAAGASDEEVVAVLVCVAPLVGTARVVAAAADLGLSLGYDVDAAFEAPTSTCDVRDAGSSAGSVGDTR